jgi:hypothetical protein
MIPQPAFPFTAYAMPTNEMQARGTEIADHATMMSSGKFPRIQVWDQVAFGINSNARNVTFNATNWTPRVDDLVIMVCASDATGIAVPAPWVNVLGGNTVVSSGVHVLYVLYRWVSYDEQQAGTLSYTADAVQGNLLGSTAGIVVRGVDPTNPVAAIASSLSTTPVTPHPLPALSGTGMPANCLVLGCMTADGVPAYQFIDGWGRAAATDANQSNYIYTRNALTSASTAVATVNAIPGASDEYCSVTLALRPIVPVPSLNLHVRRPNYGALQQF